MFFWFENKFISLQKAEWKLFSKVGSMLFSNSIQIPIQETKLDQEWTKTTTDLAQ